MTLDKFEEEYDKNVCKDVEFLLNDEPDLLYIAKYLDFCSTLPCRNELKVELLAMSISYLQMYLEVTYH